MSTPESAEANAGARRKKAVGISPKMTVSPKKYEANREDHSGLTNFTREQT